MIRNLIRDSKTVIPSKQQVLWSVTPLIYKHTVYIRTILIPPHHWVNVSKWCIYNKVSVFCLLIHFCVCVSTYHGEWWDPRQLGQSPSRAGKRREWGTMASQSGLIILLPTPAGRLGKQEGLIWHNQTLYSGLVSLPISLNCTPLLNPNWSEHPQWIS